MFSLVTGGTVKGFSQSQNFVDLSPDSLIEIVLKDIH